jgi:predicted nucleic acid-binding protein
MKKVLIDTNVYSLAIKGDQSVIGIWIASTAFQHGYKLFTRDKHFELIHGLVRVIE